MNIKDIEQYLIEHNKCENKFFGRNGEPWHNNRYLLSLEWLENYITEEVSILELGEKSIFTNLLNNFFDVKIEENTDYDLRYRFPFEADKFDLVLCMETIEHIKDQETKEYLADFTGSGIRNMLSESYRVLKSNGTFFLSTPNVCSYRNIVNMFNNLHPYFFQLHHRELSLNDVKNFVSQAGFNIIKMQTVNVWDNHGLENNLKEKITEALRIFGAFLENREDCIFTLCKK